MAREERRRTFAFAAAGVGLGITVAVLALYAQMTASHFLGDAFVYLGAGERLNAGHPLYSPSPGDRPIPIQLPFWTAPLVSPPLIAVLWRPLAALPSETGVVIMLVTLVVCAVVSLLGAGWENHIAYLTVGLNVHPAAFSLTWLLGIPWLWLATFIVGTALVLISRGNPAWSFRVAVLTMIFGTPVANPNTYALLLAVLAPADFGRRRYSELTMLLALPRIQRGPARAGERPGSRAGVTGGRRVTPYPRVVVPT